MKKSKAKLPFIIVSVLCSVIVIYYVLNIIFSPYWNSVYAPPGYVSLISMSSAESDEIVYTKAEAEEDLNYIIKCMERVHPLYINGVSDDVKKCLNKEINSFGDTVTSYEIWRSAARLLHSTGAAHDMTSPSFPMHYLADYLDRIENGYTVTKINGITVEELFLKNSDLFSYESDEWGIYLLENCFKTQEGLKFLGFDTGTFEFVYLTENNKEEAVTYYVNDFYDYESTSEMMNKETEDVPSYSCVADKENNYSVLTLDSCDYNKDFREFLYKFFEDTTAAGIDNVIVDLRNNGGGNSMVANEFILYLNYDDFKTPGSVYRLGPYMMKGKSSVEKIKHYDEMVFDGDVYVLTSNRTFSSGTLFAEFIQDNGFGKVVGEPCGNMPDGYGDVAVFQTPNSILSFQLCTKHFDRIDTSKSDEPIVPDIECPADEALDKVIEIIK